MNYNYLSVMELIFLSDENFAVLVWWSKRRPRTLGRPGTSLQARRQKAFPRVFLYTLVA